MVCVHTHTYLDVPWYLCFFFFFFFFSHFFHIKFLEKFNQRNRKISRISHYKKKISPKFPNLFVKRSEISPGKKKHCTVPPRNILPLGGNQFDWGVPVLKVSPVVPHLSIHKAMVSILHHACLLQVKLTTLKNWKEQQVATCPT